jgi:hypothetical protein
MQARHFLVQHSDLLSLAAVPSLGALQAALASAGSPPGHAALSSAVTPLLELLMTDIYHMCMEDYIESEGDEAQQRRDLQGGAPIVDGDTWPFAAAALFAGASRRPQACVTLLRVRIAACSAALQNLLVCSRICVQLACFEYKDPPSTVRQMQASPWDSTSPA